MTPRARARRPVTLRRKVDRLSHRDRPPHPLPPHTLDVVVVSGRWVDDRPELVVVVVVLAAAGLSFAGRQVALLSSSTATRATSGVCRSEMKRELLLSTVGRPIGGWDGGEGGEERREEDGRVGGRIRVIVGVGMMMMMDGRWEGGVEG